MELYAFGKTLNKGSRRLHAKTVDKPLQEFEKRSKDPNYDLEFLKYKYSKATMKNPIVMDVMTSGIMKPVDELGSKTQTFQSKDTMYGKGWVAKVAPDAVYINGQKYNIVDFGKMVRKAILYPNQPNNQLALAIANRTPVGVQFLKLLSENSQPLFKAIIELLNPNVPADQLGTDKDMLKIKGTKPKTSGVYGLVLDPLSGVKLQSNVPSNTLSTSDLTATNSANIANPFALSALDSGNLSD